MYKQNVLIMLRLSDYVQCREVIIFEHGCNISALEHVRMLILNNYVLLACINIICNMVTLGCFDEMYINFQFLGSGALYLTFETY